MSRIDRFPDGHAECGEAESSAPIGGRLDIMTGANGGAGPDAGRELRWDVALSFAGAQRNYVGQVAAALKARGVRCFYDTDRKVRLWGTHLAEELPRIYERESAVVVVFVSADYAEGDWTRLECRAAFSRAVREAGVCVLPARFDDSELPGLLEDVVAINLHDYDPGEFADLVVAKLADLGISPSPSPGEGGRRPPGGLRINEADPRRLGVHAAISVPGVLDDVPPEYVPRDADAAKLGIRAKVAVADSDAAAGELTGSPLSSRPGGAGAGRPAGRLSTPSYTAQMGHWSESLVDEAAQQVGGRPDRRMLIDVLAQAGPRAGGSVWP